MKKLYRLVRNLVIFYVEKDITALSAMLSYYMLFTFFPALLFGSSVLAKFLPQGYELPLISVIPAPVRDFAKSYLGEISMHGNGRIMFLGAVLTLWSLTKYVKNYRKALGRIYQKSRNLSFPADWGISILFSVAMPLMFILAAASVFFTDNLLTALGLYGFAGSIWYMLRFLIIALYAYLVICSVHFVECGSGMKFSDFSAGALTAVGVWAVISAIFSYYAGEIADYSAVYGSIGNVIILLVWLNMTNTVLLLSGVVNICLNKNC